MSLGGKLTQLNAILSAIPTYHLSVIHLPIRVEKEINKIRKRFLWKPGRERNRGYYLINWKRICRNRKQDGLGILNIRSFNTALKYKLIWNLISDTGNTCKKKWCRLIRSRYCQNKHLGSLLNSSSGHASPLWKELKACFAIVNSFSIFSVHNGQSVFFWHNRWLQQLSPKYLFSELYNLVKYKKMVPSKNDGGILQVGEKIILS